MDDRERIFEPYMTVKDARPVTGSVGLGLAVSRQLARLMGGDLTYSYRAAQSVFELSLCLDRAAVGSVPEEPAFTFRSV